MGKLIYADALLKTIEKHCYQVQHDRTSVEKGMTLTGIRQAINEQPEAVVRCRDCEYWDMHIDGIDKWARCDFFSTPKKVAVMTSSDGFCSDGIRKEDR